MPAQLTLKFQTIPTPAPLQTLYDGLQAIVAELDNLKKYKSLESTGNPIDRLKWGQENLDGFW